MSTKVLALVIAAMVCATVLLAARILDDPDPVRSSPPVTFCPPRLRPC